MTKISKNPTYPLKNPIVGDYFADSENEGKTINGFRTSC
jgi:hypothetical protein